MQAPAVAPARLEQLEGALDVGPDERLRPGDGVVVVALGRVVHHGVRLGHELVEQGRVADVAHHKPDAVGVEPRQVLRVARVGELVQHGHAAVGVLRHPAGEVGADEAGPSRDDDVPGLELVGHTAPLSKQ